MGWESTSVVDKHIDPTMASLDFLKSRLNRAVAREIDLQQLDRIGGIRTFFVQRLDSNFAFLWRTTAEEDVVGGLIGLEECFDGLVTYP